MNQIQEPCLSHRNHEVVFESVNRAQFCITDAIGFDLSAGAVLEFDYEQHIYIYLDLALLSYIKLIWHIAIV